MNNQKVQKCLSVVMILLLVFSLFTTIVPHNNVRASNSQEIEEGNLRIHYDNNTVDVNEIGVWLWGDVANPSDQQGEWPNGTWFNEEYIDSYGAYVDIELSKEAKAISLLIVNRDGEKVTKDITIDILDPMMKEVWISHTGEVYYYQPENIGSNKLRIHYKKEDTNYEPWGIWSWGNVLEEPKEWPTDAIPFSNNQIGKYGAYVDLLLKDELGSLGFLLVNRSDGTQTSDMTFSDFKSHQQIFVKEGSNEVYTNPYYVSVEDSEENTEEHEGQYDISLEGNVNRELSYNDHALLEVAITNNSDKEIKEIYADTTALGGSERLSISPQLNKVTVSVNETIQPGEKIIPVTAVDEEGGIYTSEVSVTVAENLTENKIDWDESVIYFMLTDRFNDGDIRNNDPYELNYQSYDNERGTYQGGDFKGVIDKLDYLEELGINTIWITPIVENIGHDVNYNAEEGSYFGYHGYWAKDFEKLNPHLGTLDEFHQLIDLAAEKGIKIMVDVVLNHAGYGLKGEQVDIPGYPTEEDILRFNGMLRQQSGSGDEKMELSGLPDFETENKTVRDQLVTWQTNWIEKTKTAKGNSIAYYRVDTVKHVDKVTWQHFRNQLTLKKPDFQLIGEAWGAGPSNHQGYLQSGTMDSLLDFEFKNIAKLLVDGKIEQVTQSLQERNEFIQSNRMLGQFLSSHDEDGFLYKLNGNQDKFKIAASLQMTSKGQPVIYYGEELAQSGANNWPQYDNRYNMAWDDVENNDMLVHYKKLLAFREQHSDILAKGNYQKIAGSDNEQFLLYEREWNNDQVYVGLNIANEARQLQLTVSQANTEIINQYNDETYAATANENGEFVIKVELPSIDNGGTALLHVSNGEITSVQANEEEPTIEEIPKGHLRVHFEQSSQSYEELGLWTWKDVKEPSETTGSWPDAASKFHAQNVTSFGRYVDVPLIENAREIGLLINNRNGENVSGDLNITLLSNKMNQVWITKDYKVYLYEPLSESNKLRINFYQDEGSYNEFGVWTWGDVKQPTENWPVGAHYFSDDMMGWNGSYTDIALADSAKQVHFLILNKDTAWQTEDFSFSDINNHTQIFIRKGDDSIYTNPYFIREEGLMSADILSSEKIELTYSSIEGLTEEAIKENVEIIDSEGRGVPFNKVTIERENNVVLLHGTFSLNNSPFTIKHDEREVTATIGWRLKDELYSYEGELGLTLHDKASATLKLWAPSADHVSVILYDKKDQTKMVKNDIMMKQQDRGVWQVELNESNTGLQDIRGYYYHFAVERDGETVLALDPYAKSMAAWNSNDPNQEVGKAAIVNPSEIGPSLTYASIDGFDKREDAIIYEVHVRDFTSDPSIEEELSHRFGTFTSFIEKLDYIKDLGVTHIQLLPVMSYYFADELSSDERLLEYSSTENNYNWGYDPHSYFSLTGMYSENPNDPAKRIEEFKLLIEEIHKRGMGVILDVVYNHTAKVDILENIEPNYYHFMDADGTPRESFGGGRLGTTHKMSRKLLVDSILYWVDEFKMDGFRFDMMGDHDSETIQMAYDKAKELNPHVLMIGEGWRTFTGDEKYPSVQSADQDWMQYTNSVASFSDEFRNELKSGFGSEGEPRFLTGGARNIQTIFNNLTAKPGNFITDDPGDVVPYIAAHDNLTLHDVIAQSIKKDPKIHAEEIHQRIRLGNLMVLTAQGTPFIHAGQEFGRTKQFRDEEYRQEVEEAPYKSTLLTDENNQPFEYPYFIHDSYDSSDAINMFDWEKATNSSKYPIHTTTRAYTKGLIELRRSTDVFRLGTMEEVDKYVSLINAEEMKESDLIIGYSLVSPTTGDTYYVFVNADQKERTFTIENDLTKGSVLVDNITAGITPIKNPAGVSITSNTVNVAPLSAAVIHVANSKQSSESPINENEENTGNDLVNEEISENIGENKPNQEENQLPNTTTTMFRFILIGAVLLISALGIFIINRRRMY